MAAIPSDFGSGGKGLFGGLSATEPSLANALRDVADDLANIRTAFVGLTAKLDGEDVTNLDTDYASTLDPVALLTTKA